ncbi:MAG: hypothetical protein ACOY5Y_17765 [Pseudomonadota bacterium]|jgi:hypothetical protein
MDARTLLGLAAAGCAAAAAFAGWRGARPPNPMKGPRLIPWRAIMVAAATAAILLATLAVQVGGGLA